MRIRAHKVGAIWETKFQELWRDPSLTNNELYEACGLGRGQIERERRRLNLPLRNHDWWKSQRKRAPEIASAASEPKPV